MPKNLSILIVEDEPKILEGLRDFLEFHGFSVTGAADGLEAERLAGQHRFDLILLDLMLPKISGEQLCTKWRQAGLSVPIIMLTAKGQEHERIEGLNLGADDYLSKPFSLEELLARMRAVLRRTDPARSVTRTFRLGPLTVDCGGLKVCLDGREQPITRREADLLCVFASSPGRVVSRAELYRAAWGDSLEDLETRTVDMHIATLRGKIESAPADPRIIRTVRGAGYIYEGDSCTGG